MTKKKVMSDDLGEDVNPMQDTHVVGPSQSGTEQVLSDVKLKEVMIGDTIVAIGHDSNCIHDGQEYEVVQGGDGELCVACDEGEHYLQADEHGFLESFGARK